MPEFIPFTERPEFIPRTPKGQRLTFAQAAALFAYGDVDGVLTDFIATLAAGTPPPPAIHPTPTRAAVPNGVAHGR